MIPLSDFKGLRDAINVGAVTSLDGIWRYVTVRDLFKRAKMNAYRPAIKRMVNPRLLTLHESDRLARAVGVTGFQFFGLIASSLASYDPQK